MITYQEFGSSPVNITTYGAITLNKYLGDTLDYITFSCKSDDYTFQKFGGIINFQTDNYGETHQFTPYSCEYNSLTDLLVVTAIDPTRILDEITVNGIAVTNQTTQLAGFNFLIDKLNERIYGDLKTLFFNNNTYEVLDNNSACQELIMDGIHTLREILDYYLSTWDLSVRCKFSSINNYHLFLYVVSPNKIGTEIDTSLLNYKASVNGENFSDSIVCDAKNMVVDESVYERGLSIVSDSVPFSTDNAYLELCSNIYETKSVVPSFFINYMHIIVGARHQPITSGYTINNTTDRLKVDIEDYVKDKEEYDTLSTHDRICCYYYTRGNKKIEHILTLEKDSPNDVNMTVFRRSIESAFQDMDDLVKTTYDYDIDTDIYSNIEDNPDEVKAWWLMQDQAWRDEIVNCLLTSPGESLDYTTYPILGFKIFGINVNIALNTVWKDAWFDIDYYTKDTFHTRIGNRGLSIIDNQSNGTLDETRYFNSMSYKFQRLNSSEIEVSTNENVYEVGDYVGDSVLDRLQIAYNGLNEQCNYHFQQNYNAVGERVDVNRELRLYAIPETSYIKAVIEIEDSNAFNSEGIVLTTTVVKESSTFTAKTFVPFIKLGNQRVIRFRDNYAVRCYFTTDTIGWWGATANVTEALRYCNADGELVSLTYTCANYKGEDTSNPPDQLYTAVGTSQIITVYKDAYEQLELVFKGVS